MPFWKISIFALIVIAIILMYAGQWKTLRKAGKPGWAALIPIYNTIVFFQVAGRPVWWIALVLIPFVDLIIIFVVISDIARRFGKGTLFALGLVLLPFIFWPILGFSKLEYHGFDADEEYEKEEGWEEDEGEKSYAV